MSRESKVQQTKKLIKRDQNIFSRRNLERSKTSKRRREKRLPNVNHDESRNYSKLFLKFSFTFSQRIIGQQVLLGINTIPTTNTNCQHSTEVLNETFAFCLQCQQFKTAGIIECLQRHNQSEYFHQLSVEREIVIEG